MVRQINNEQQTKIFKGPGGLNAATFGKIKDLGYGFALKDSDNNNRIIAYIDENGDPIFKISKPGNDATTASDDDLYLNSTQNIFKIVQKYTLTVDPTANPPGTYNSYTAVQAHGLGSPRAIYGFVDSVNGGSVTGRTNLPNAEIVTNGVPPAQSMVVGTYKWIYIDNTNITAVVETSTLCLNTYSFTVYLEQETAS